MDTRYNQVKDLITWAADYHARMAKRYSDGADRTDNERLSMALTYLASREVKMQSGLEALFHDGSDHSEVMELWFDETGDFPQPPRLEAITQRSVADSIDGVIETASEAQENLRALYAHRAECAKIEEEAAFFNSLAEGHEAELRKIVTSMREFEDI
ncbi:MULTISPECIES: 2-hydroxyacyl-CoA dehydratase [unclassified Halomonas]|uniref:2-hydroxyacyl-CoA dehydratase n=1 Tax=unclassified Halomonas TaxID=2609666 RepID=UPI0021E3A499|nr:MULTISPECIES: 2-hydroxyacyl-CoA dehydratase [unclassified Halomonas]UYG01338.1 2-hydroxyacyl-CoA dehydratase [Halomonas sp. GD1P12]WNL40919.1 2-hydroxyacyl-CoA dehydratase [Halomonas sp. PAMB 3264]